MVPAVGLGAVLTTLVGYLLRYSTATIAAEQERTKTAERRAEQAQRQVDAEREKRRDAETAAASASAELLVQRRLADYWAREARRIAPYLPRPVPPGVLPDPPDWNDEGGSA